MRLAALPVLLLLSLLSVIPAAAQSNPTPDTCGLPKKGSLYTAVTYTLTANCTQTGQIHISPNLPANSTVTIDGKGYTVDATALNNSKPFVWCVGHTKGTKLVIKDLTIKGGGRSGNGALRLVKCNNTLTNVTLTESYGRAIFIQSGNDTATTTTATSVLIEKTKGLRYQWVGESGAVSLSGKITASFTNTVIRDIVHNSAAVKSAAEDGNTPTVTFSGCLTKQRIHPEFTSDTITDSSTGACSGTIGNKGSADLANPEPVTAACGMPLAGVLQNSAQYSLSADCQLTDTLYIPTGLSVKINGNGYTIKSASGKYGISTAGTTTIDGVVFDGGSNNNIFAMHEGALTVKNTTFKNQKQPIRIMDPPVTFDRVLFEDNDVGTWAFGSVMLVMRTATVTVKNSIMRDNTGAGTSTSNGAIHIGYLAPGFTTKPSVTISGCKLWSNNTPADSFISGTNGTLTDNSSGDPCTYAGAPPPGVPKFTLPSLPSASSAGLYIPATPIACTGAWLNDRAGYRIRATYDICDGAQFQRRDISAIGIQWIVDAGPLDVVDAWGWIRPTAEVCFPQAGSMLFISTSNGARSVMPLDSFRDGDLTCARIGQPGTIVLLPADSPHSTPPADNPPGPLVAPVPEQASAPVEPTAVPTAIPSTPLSNCMVRTKAILNMRASPNGRIVGLVPWEAWLTALEYAPGWYKIDFHGERGWISADYVEPRGSCA